MAQTQSPTLTLGIPGYEYSDLYQPRRLQNLLTSFDDYLRDSDASLADTYMAYRKCKGEGMDNRDISDILVRVGPHVGIFTAKLFGIDDIRHAQVAEIKEEFCTVFAFRSEVVAKLKTLLNGEDVADYDLDTIEHDLALLEKAFPAAAGDSDDERSLSRMGAALALLTNHYKLLSKGKDSDYTEADDDLNDIRKSLQEHAENSEMIKAALAEEDSLACAEGLLKITARWAAIAKHRDDLQDRTEGWDILRDPAKTDFNNLVKHDIFKGEHYKAWVAHERHLRRRDGFNLTDPRFGERRNLYEIDHCIFCHERNTDSCSKGMINKKTGDFQTNQLGILNSGCPLGEKISEMQLIKREGDNIGALAAVMIDNPMCPGTGHRICNECMKGCIYQKTEPVNIPQVETNVLMDVLNMPWGFEIYSLLTRWNPLNVQRPTMLPYNGKNVLVVGMGPSGYTMSHYLLNEGFGVVGIEALKLEPLPEELVGSIDKSPVPVRDFADIYEQLGERRLNGFGGVAEYGITVRWDKNFLKVIYAILLRRQSFRAYGGVRFGGTITINEAWDMGFDHICIAAGAGKPTIIGLKNNLIRGIRKASDFLMSLQLTGASKRNTMANLQVRLPAGVIGGGLTGIDTATELLAYYPLQVEKTLDRFETLSGHFGKDTIRKIFDEEELIILDEFLGHGQQIRAERERAETLGETPNFLPLLNAWGGSTMFYRKGMKDSPAYRQNHEEIAEALDEGIRLAEGMNPKKALADDYGHLNAVQFERMAFEDGKWVSSGYNEEVPIRSLYVAAGTSPNTIYESEFPGTFKMDGKFFQRFEPQWEEDEIKLVEKNDGWDPKVSRPSPLTSYEKNGKYISFYGDNHPVYAGNVVKAMASAKDGYPFVSELFEQELAALDPNDQDLRDAALNALFQHLDDTFSATVVAVNRLTPTIIEIVVKAPSAAQKFKPGQFYRVQNFEAYAPVIGDTIMTTEGIALTGAEVDVDAGTISLIVLEMGSSTRLCATWKPGDKLVVMGVTGAPTEIPSGQTVALLGGGLGNAVLFSIGKALRAAGNKVIYFAGYKLSEDVFKIEDLEAASDIIVWSVDPGQDVTAIPTTRPQDKTFVGNILETMLAYAKGELGDTPIHLDDVDEMIVIGSHHMMSAVKEARSGVLKPYLKMNHHAIGSINSPMQCMMKGICAQCMCKHKDKKTGEEYFVYSCYNQDQDLDKVDFPNLNARLRQNTVQEKISSLWLKYILETNQVSHV